MSEEFIARKIRPVKVLVEMARRIAKFTQKELYKETGISQPHISDLEHGRRPATTKRLIAISKATDCSFWICGKGVVLVTPDETKDLEEWFEEPEIWGVEE